MSYSLLIIDDDEDIRLILCSVLASIDSLTLFEAADGATAQELIQNHKIDGIILDHQLPDISGEELLVIFKDSSSPRDPEVVMLSARDDQDLTEKWLHMGAKAVLKKPFNPFELLAQLKVHLEF
ncbi:MAG: response regulator [Candidatus Marinimicrobia bacterium]|jgi:two-component system response regulator VanR|nr:response regulator [Candidatus Neomarinimicrobiota bacterium]MBT3574988.1 response regulator [Candidatus Neomarinimicrobiota bacterium]MBT3679210.1 response regulator [Candidatus Neomarinimicrobiota bacterium]MBT4131263.1 response regulator [Candidatus Neomarinimicrobiota bacterium]MBT4253620.1 response regulator [Candidatus Neomarinimicrobiota bacterium]